MVFQKLSIHEDNTLAFSKDNMRVASNIPNIPIQTRFNLGVILLIPENVEHVIEIEELILLFRYQTLDSPKLTLLYKILKAARLAMTDRVILNRTNTELLVANI